MHELNEAETAATIAGYGLDDPEAVGFGFRDRGRAVAYGWHAHGRHQLLYAASGTARLETAEARYVLPPQRAAWIPAGTRHRTTLSDVDGASVYFAPDAVAEPGRRVRILAATPLLREMVLHALRWPRGSADDPLARHFFTALALLCAEWLRAPLALELSRSDHPAIARAMDYALAAPARASQAGALAAAHMSERSFRRAFRRETGTSWQAWLHQARIMAAMARLERGERVTVVAGDVGFASLSAFAKAFARAVGERPADYRRRAARRTAGHG